MIRNVLTSMSGIEWYGIISLLIFFIFFVGMLVWVLRLSKPYLESMCKLPIDGGELRQADQPQSQAHFSSGDQAHE